MLHRRLNWLALVTNLFSLVIAVLLVFTVTRAALAAEVDINDGAGSIGGADTIIFFSAADLIDSISKDPRAADKHYLRDVAEVDGLIKVRLSQQTGAGVRFDGVSPSNLLEPTFFFGFRSRW